MRRIVIALASTVTGLVLLFSYPTSLTRSAPGAIGGTADASSGALDSTDTSAYSAGSGSSGTFTGDAVQTRFGAVQVEIAVSDDVIVDASAIRYPSGDRHNDQINGYALPILATEVLQAQTADIDLVSGATVTSAAYVESLQSAIDQANL